MAKVKRRRYDARGRREKAESTRTRVLDVARAAFLANGYAATTLQEIASSADVSVETIHKAFGGKAGLVRALWARSLEGRGATPAPRRSDAMSAREEDGGAIVRGWGVLMAEVSPLVSPIVLLARAAAASDPALAQVVEESDAQRLERMRANARRLKDRGFLRKGVSVERAADIMWAWTSEQTYELFVVRRGWSPKELGTYVGEMMVSALLRSQ